MSTSTILYPNPVCPQCACKSTAKKGKRRNRLQTLQVYRCTECLHRFTGEPGKNKTYPLRLILDTVSIFNLGHSLTQTQQLMRKRFHRQIPERTIGSWLTEYRPLTTYARLRVSGRKRYSPQLIVRSHTFHHQQVYRFQVHRAKLDLLMLPTTHTATHANSEFAPLKNYLASIQAHPNPIHGDIGSRPIRSNQSHTELCWRETGGFVGARTVFTQNQRPGFHLHLCRRPHAGRPVTFHTAN